MLCNHLPNSASYMANICLQNSNQTFLEGNQADTIGTFCTCFTSQLNPIDKITWLNHQLWLRWLSVHVLIWCSSNHLEIEALDKVQTKGNVEYSSFLLKVHHCSLQSTRVSKKEPSSSTRLMQAYKYWWKTCWRWRKIRNLYFLEDQVATLVSSISRKKKFWHLM